MDRPLSDSDLIVATPERVSFDYQVAGLGTRAIAQLIDLLIVAAVEVAVLFFGFAAGSVTNSGTVSLLIIIVFSFINVFGYFWVSEALFRANADAPLKGRAPLNRSRRGVKKSDSEVGRMPE